MAPRWCHMVPLGSTLSTWPTDLTTANRNAHNSKQNKLVRSEEQTRPAGPILPLVWCLHLLLSGPAQDGVREWGIQSCLPGFTKSARKVYIYKDPSQLPLFFPGKQPSLSQSPPDPSYAHHAVL